jgi:hypothetical protein
MTDPSSKLIKSRPIPADPGALSILGHVLEVEIGGAILTWKKGDCELLWSPQAKALLWFDAEEQPIEVDDDAKISAATRVFERFKDREANRYRRARYPVSGQWRSYGRAVRVDYHSDKWGQRASYTHELGSGVILYRQGPVHGPWLFALRGGRLRITKRGIEG